MTDKFDDFKDRIEEAAIQAELETGEREETVEEAKTNAMVRVARMTLGFVVVIIGIIALPLPGPGWLIIAGGLTILSKDVAWADRLLRYIRKRVPGIPEDGKIPRSSMVTMAVVTLAAVSASLWWTFGRGSDAIQAGTYVVTELTDPTASVPITDEVTGVEFGESGPFTLDTTGCGTIDFEVDERSKGSFELNEPTMTGECPGSVGRLIDVMSNSTIEFGYTTDGIVEWFFADDHIERLNIVADNGTTWSLELETSVAS